MESAAETIPPMASIEVQVRVKSEGLRILSVAGDSWRWQTPLGATQIGSLTGARAEPR